MLELVKTPHRGNIIPTVLLILIILYWLVAIIGAIDFDFLDFDFDLDLDFGDAGFSLCTISFSKGRGITFYVCCEHNNSEFLDYCYVNVLSTYTSGRKVEYNTAYTCFYPKCVHNKD